jgi:iron complex outermembrane receptor protein
MRPARLATRGLVWRRWPVFAIALSASLWLSPCDAQSAATLPTDIPAQALDPALMEFARQSQLQLIYVSKVVIGRTTKGAPAGLTPISTLGRLLDGTGLSYEFLNARTVRIFAPVRSGATRPRALRNGGERPEARPDGSESVPIAEIVVTSSASNVPVGNVPASLAVWSQESMDASGIRDVVDIAALTPGTFLTLNSVVGSDLLLNIIIRGIAPAGGGTPTTGVYIDDTPVQVPNELNSVLDVPLPVTFDLNRVEILRGPQGTLAGDGSEGGLVRFVMNQPSLTTFSGRVRTGLATTERGSVSYDVGAAAGGPIIDGIVGFRASALVRNEGGFIDHVNPADGTIVEANSNWSRTRAVRAAVAWAPSEAFSVTPSIHYQTVTVHDAPVYFVSMSDPTAGVFRNGKLLLQPADTTFYMPSIKAEVALGAADLTSVTSMFERTGSITVDLTDRSCCFSNRTTAGLDTSLADVVPQYVSLWQSGFSQVVRLSSKDPTRRVGWLAGVQFARSRQHEVVDTPATRGAIETGSYGTFDYRDTEAEYDAFANADLKLTPRLTVSGGLRLGRATHDSVHYLSGVFRKSVAPFYTGDGSDGTITPRLGAAFQASADTLYYASIASGYRVGGLNAHIPASCNYAVPQSFKPETLWNYELGAKLSRLGNRLQLDGSVFHVVWRDLQQYINLPCGWGDVENAGAAASDGFDFSVRAAPGENITVGLALEYAHARHIQNVDRLGFTVVQSGDALGQAAVAPFPWSGVTSIEWHPAVTERGIITLRADDAYQRGNPGPFWSDNPAAISYGVIRRHNPSTNLLNLRVGIRAGHADAWLYVSNALNSHPVLSQIGAPGPPSAVAATTFRPRTVGLTANWLF